MKIPKKLRDGVCAGEVPEPDLRPLIKQHKYTMLFDGTKIVPFKP